MKISVIIPTYNRENTIKRAIESVLNQDYTEIEVIVVDDCSTDNTYEIVKGISDGRLRYFKLEKNSGACRARNFGIDKATGEFIAFQDSDDVWKENKLSIQLQVLKEKKVDAITCNYLQIDTRTGKKKQCINHCKEGNIPYELLLKENIVSTQCILIKTECLNLVRFDENLKKYQDWDFALNLLRKYKVYFLNRILVDVYLQEDSITRHKEYNLEACKIIYSKHEKAIFENNILNSLWHRRIGRAKLAQGTIATEEFKNAFSAKANLVDLSYYIMAKIGIILWIRKIKNHIFSK